MKSLASLIIPTYNVEKYIKETLGSVKRQTINSSDFETIIFDDCSKDNTVDIIKKEIKGICNFNFAQGRINQGASYAKNEAINFANGEYILLLDGDDVLEPNALQSTLEFMYNNPQIQHSYSRHKRIDKDGNCICDRPGYAFSRERLLHFNFVGAIECFTKKHFDKLGGFDYSSYVEDYDFVLRGSEVLDDDQIVQHPIYLYKYRIHKNNKSIEGLQKSRVASILAIQNSLKRKEDIYAKVFWSHITDDKYNYFDWNEK